MNFHFLGRGFLGHGDCELEQPIAEACLDVVGLHALQQGYQAFDGTISELALYRHVARTMVLISARPSIKRATGSFL
jgi:hypothetical protein